VIMERSTGEAERPRQRSAARAGKLARGTLGFSSRILKINDDSDYTLHFLPATSVRKDGAICSSWYDRRRASPDSALIDCFAECRGRPAQNATDFQVTTGRTDWTNTPHRSCRTWVTTLTTRRTAAVATSSGRTDGSVFPSRLSTLSPEEVATERATSPIRPSRGVPAGLRHRPAVCGRPETAYC
jgi:hypothetical protein